MIPIVIYARFSSHAQTEQSIEGQLKVCYDYAERNGYTVVGEYIDRAISGTAAENRPDFLRMIADSAKRQFKYVLVYQLDRFARNRYDSATFKNKLKKNGVRVISARENISDDASGILMETVLEGMAEYFSVELSQKIRRGMSINAEKCLCTGGNIALGYDIGDDKRFVINEGEAAIVRRIFEMYLAGNTMADIIRNLNETGVKSSRGNEYGKNSIRKILTNKKYKGIYVYKDIEIPDGVPRIIDDTTFEQAQILLEKNKKAPARAKAIDENYLLTTKVFCGFYKAAMTGVSGTSHTEKIYQYYWCFTQRNKRGDCKKKTERKKTLEDVVIDEIMARLNDGYIDNIARKIADLSVKEGNTETVKRLKKLLKENEDATVNLVKAIEQGNAVDVLSSQIEKRQRERADLETQLAKEKLLCPILTFDEVKFFFERFKNGDPSNPVFRMSLIDTFVSKIFVYDDEDTWIEIYCNGSERVINIPLDKPSKGSPKGTLVEARRVELLSENTSPRTSPGAGNL